MLMHCRLIHAVESALHNESQEFFDIGRLSSSVLSLTTTFTWWGSFEHKWRGKFELRVRRSLTSRNLSTRPNDWDRK